MAKQQSIKRNRTELLLSDITSGRLALSDLSQEDKDLLTRQAQSQGTSVNALIGQVGGTQTNQREVQADQTPGAGPGKTPLSNVGGQFEQFLRELKEQSAAERSFFETQSTSQRALFEQDRSLILGQTLENEQRAMALAQARPEELRDLEVSFAETGKLLEREKRFIDAINPALMEASKQTLALLRGEESSFNAPVQQQRAQQRQELVGALRDQFGPGAETSAIGQQRLRAFDQESNTLSTQLRQSALSQTFGIASTDVLGGLRAAAGAQAGIAGVLSQGRTDQSLRQLNTQLGLGASRLSALTGVGQQAQQLESQLGAQGLGLLSQQGQLRTGLQTQGAQLGTQAQLQREGFAASLGVAQLQGQNAANIARSDRQQSLFTNIAGLGLSAFLLSNPATAPAGATSLLAGGLRGTP